MEKNVRFTYNAFLRDKFRFTERDIEFLIQVMRFELTKTVNKVNTNKDDIDYILDLIDKLKDIEI